MLFKYSLYIRVDEKEEIDTAFQVFEKFHQYLEENTNKAELDGSHLYYEILKDFRNPEKGQFEDDRFRLHTVRMNFYGSITEEERQTYKEELIQKWDEFESTYE